MSTFVSSPPPTPPKLPAQCICALTEITNQLLNEDAVVRFQCLAYHRYGRSPHQRRCDGSCETQSRPQVFERAKQVLQRKGPVNFEDYVEFVIRILFCKTHSEAKAFGKYRDLFKQHWEGDGNPRELELLEAIRQAYQLPSARPARGPNIVELTSPPSSDPSGPKPEAEGPGLNVQLNTPLVPPNTGSVTGAPPGQGQPAAFTGPSLPSRRRLVPTRPSQRIRNRSNPPQQRNDIRPAAMKSANTTDGTAKYSAIAHASSNPFGIPSDGSFNFRCLALDDQFTLRQERNEAPNILLEPTSSIHNSNAPLSRTSVSSEQVADTSAEAVSSSSLPEGSKSIAHDRNTFLQAEWDSCDFSSSFDASGLKRSPFRPTAMAMRSKDDTFVEQLSSSAAKAAPTLFQTTIQPSVPPPESSTGPDKKFIPLLVDNWIRTAIMKPVTKEGHVYILKAPKYFEENYPGEPPLVKIGISMDVKKRVFDLKTNCGLFDLERVEDSQDISHKWYYKVEELVHSELANFNRVLKCGKCRTGKGEGSAHREWFAVSETVALHAVQRWRNFILEEPYDDNGILTDHWSEMLRPANIPRQSAGEEYYDHELRNNRWNRWLEEGIKATRRLK